MDMTMHFYQSPMWCQKCGNEWRQQMIAAPISVVIAHWKSLRCRQCGAGWKSLSAVWREAQEAEAEE